MRYLLYHEISFNIADYIRYLTGYFKISVIFQKMCVKISNNQLYLKISCNISWDILNKLLYLLIAGCVLIYFDVAGCVLIYLRKNKLCWKSTRFSTYLKIYLYTVRYRDIL